MTSSWLEPYRTISIQSDSENHFIHKKKTQSLLIREELKIVSTPTDNSIMWSGLYGHIQEYISKCQERFR